MTNFQLVTGPDGWQLWATEWAETYIDASSQPGGRGAVYVMAAVPRGRTRTYVLDGVEADILQYLALMGGRRVGGLQWDVPTMGELAPAMKDAVHKLIDRGETHIIRAWMPAVLEEAGP
jgi:hypothetical protein